tara:strand:+ start:1647 stop:2261 length:615 start_codon:yes stop_codon:yes gene_type:complete
MRQIETKMINAIKDGKGMTSGNTEVEVMSARSDEYSGEIVCQVSLHGNHIATVYALTVGDGEPSLFAMPNLFTLHKWPTPTTKSRLRALGVHVWTEKGRTFVTVPVWGNESGSRTYCVHGGRKIDDALSCQAGQRDYLTAKHRVRHNHSTDRWAEADRQERNRQLSPLLNVAQDLVINSDLKGLADLPEGIYILDELAGHGEKK